MSRNSSNFGVVRVIQFAQKGLVDILQEPNDKKELACLLNPKEEQLVI